MIAMVIEDAGNLFPLEFDKACVLLKSEGFPVVGFIVGICRLQRSGVLSCFGVQTT